MPTSICSYGVPTTQMLRIEHPAAGVTALWLDRPERRNALDAVLTEELHRAFARCGDDVVVLGTTDPCCFSSGADLDLEDAVRAKVSDELYRLHGVMLSVPGPILAVVQGAAVAGGALLAVACDLRIGDRSTWFRFSGMLNGIVTGAWVLPDLVGRGRALDICLTTRPVHAEEALAIGLLTRIEEDAPAAALRLAGHLATLDTEARAHLKEITTAPLRDAQELERSLNRATWSGAVGTRPRSADDRPTSGRATV
jgi:enoyl-CoA hydratase/carnithine racemase